MKGCQSCHSEETQQTGGGYNLHALMNGNLLVGVCLVLYHFSPSFLSCLSRLLVSFLILHILISIWSTGKKTKYHCITINYCYPSYVDIFLPSRNKSCVIAVMKGTTGNELFTTVFFSCPFKHIISICLAFSSNTNPACPTAGICLNAKGLECDVNKVI